MSAGLARMRFDLQERWSQGSGDSHQVATVFPPEQEDSLKTSASL